MFIQILKFVNPNFEGGFPIPQKKQTLEIKKRPTPRKVLDVCKLQPSEGSKPSEGLSYLFILPFFQYPA
jgi:hypothetical protein